MFPGKGKKLSSRTPRETTRKILNLAPGLLGILLILLGVVSCTLDSLDDSKFGPTSGMIRMGFCEKMLSLAYHLSCGVFEVLLNAGIGRQHRTPNAYVMPAQPEHVFSPDFGGSFQNCLFLYGRLFQGETPGSFGYDGNRTWMGFGYPKTLLSPSLVLSYHQKIL